MSAKYNDCYYYSGGIAEFLSNPSFITFKLFSKWLTGQNCIGKAMDLLNVPVNKIDKPIPEIYNGRVVVNLLVEDETYLNNTLYGYSYDRGLNQKPRLKFLPSRLLSLTAILNTAKLVKFQINLISNSKNSSDILKRLSESIKDPKIKSFGGSDAVIEYMNNFVWPQVLAIGYISDYISSYLQQTDKKYLANLNSIQNLLRKEDWYFASTQAPNKLTKGELSYEEFIEQFGMRADNDYELTCPRWHEIDLMILKSKSAYENQVSEHKIDDDILNINPKYILLKNSIVQRSEAKRKALLYMDLLRKLLIQEGKIDEKVSNQIIELQSATNFQNLKLVPKIKSGKGIGVSIGTQNGRISFIDEIEKASKVEIGIFPEAGTTYSHIYQKCAGIIFLRGGITSHGSIVAREYHIPAIIDDNCSGLQNGDRVKINGETGEWEVCSE